MNRILTIFVFLICVTAIADNGSGRPPKMISRTYGFSGTLADMGLYYSLTEATATPAAGNTWESNTAIYDFKLGYITESKVYYGLLYSGRRDNQTAPDHSTGAGVGAGIGYFGYNGFNIRGFYKVSDNFGEYKDGTGFQIDLGYAINPTSNLYLGLNISYRETVYKTNATIAGFQPWNRRETYPFVTVGYLYF